MSLESRRTRLVQRRVYSVARANDAFLDAGYNGDEVCIVATPSPPCSAICCCVCLTSVPTGGLVLWQNFGKNMGEMQPGPKWCLPVWKTVSHVVSKQMITFNALPKKCATSDMVFIDINLSVNFRIGPEVEKIETFVFKMGAERLDSYLNYQVEETIRALVYSVKHNEVNDLRSEFANECMTKLQSKVAAFGVNISNVKITDVQLPRELQDRLEATTAFKTRVAEEAKTHENNKLGITNTHEQRLAEVSQSFSIQAQRLRAEIERYDIKMDESMAVAQSTRNVKIENARGDMEVAVTKARGEVEVASFTGRREANELVTSTAIMWEKKLQGERVQCMSNTKAAESELAAARYLAEARMAESTAEGTEADQLENKRLFQQRMRLAEIDATLASRGRRLIAGRDGQKLMDGFTAIRDTLAPAPVDMDR